MRYLIQHKTRNGLVFSETKTDDEGVAKAVLMYLATKHNRHVSEVIDAETGRRIRHDAADGTVAVYDTEGRLVADEGLAG